MQFHKKWVGWSLLVPILWLLLGFNPSFSAEIEGYPKKPIKMISSWPGGGGGDQETRAISLYLKKYLKAEIIIENIPGADTRIAVTKAWKSEPDGYTLIYITPPQSILNENMFKVDFKTKEFVPIYNFFNRVITMTVHVDSWKNIEEFAKDVKGKSYSIGLSSLGSAAHLNALGSAKTFGIYARWVPFASGTEAVTQLAGKHLDVAFTMGTTALPLVRAGKIRALLRFSEVPVTGFENVPSPSDKGFSVPMISGLGGIVAPPKTPANIIKILEQASEKVSRDPEFLDWSSKTGHDILRLNSQEFMKKLLDQYKIVEDNMPFIRESMKK